MPIDPLELDFHDAEVETLADNEWLALLNLKAPHLGIDGYVFSHEGRCNGNIVAILPYRRVGKDAWEALLRDEVVPPWGLSSSLCAITGGCDHDDEEPVEVARRELKEEAGYDVPVEELRSLGTCRGTKSTDTVFHLFTLDVTSMEQGEATGDGSRLEDEASTAWSSEPEKCDDPLVSVMWARLKL